MDVVAAFIGEKEDDMVIAPFWKWGSTETQLFFDLHLGLSKWRLVADIHKYGISCLHCQKQQRHTSCPNLKWVSTGPQRFLVLYIGSSWHCANIWDHNCTMDCLSTIKDRTQKAKHWFHNDRCCNLQSDQKGISGCYFTDFDQVQLSNSQARALYQSTDGPAGQPADYPPNFDWLGDVHYTAPELTVRVHWQPGHRIWSPFGSDPDSELKQRSGTVANTSHCNRSPLKAASWQQV